MKHIGIQQLLTLAGTVVVDIFLVWFGIQLLAFSHDLSSTGFFVIGLAACFGGIFIVSPPTRGRIITGSVVFLLGIYYFLRAFGVIQSSVLSSVLGVASLFAAALLTYLVLTAILKPAQSHHKADQNQ